MTPLEIIALAMALLKAGKAAYDGVARIIAGLKLNREMTAEEREAFAALLEEAPDYARPRD